MRPICLASASPRRAEILSALGLNFTIHPTDADETLPSGLSPQKAVLLLSQRKAACITGSDAPILAADTLVCMDGILYGKPTDDADAVRMLRALSGRTHQVFTGITLICNGESYSDVCTTFVTFRKLSQEDINAYVRTGEPLGKAGAYGIQGRGGMLIRQIRGDYFNVVGLPVSTLITLFLHAGISITELMKGGAK